jgi:hypothetical protein
MGEEMALWQPLSHFWGTCPECQLPDSRAGGHLSQIDQGGSLEAAGVVLRLDGAPSGGTVRCGCLCGTATQLRGTWEDLGLPVWKVGWPRDDFHPRGGVQGVVAVQNWLEGELCIRRNSGQLGQDGMRRPSLSRMEEEADHSGAVMAQDHSHGDRRHTEA